MEINTSALWDSIKTRVCFKQKAGLSTGFLLVFENQCAKLRGRRGWPLRSCFSLPSGLVGWKGRGWAGFGGGGVIFLFDSPVRASYYILASATPLRSIRFFRGFYFDITFFNVPFSFLSCSIISIFLGAYNPLINS